MREFVRRTLDLVDKKTTIDKESKGGGAVRILQREEIVSLCDFDEMASAIERSYIAVSSGSATIPPVGYIQFPEQNGDCHIKYGHLHGDDVFVIKIATGFYNNPKLGLPTSNGMMVALSAKTGEVLAVLQDEGYLTDVRTAIGAAIATKALARPSAKKLLVIGAGIQAREQVLAHNRFLPERDFKTTIWARNKDKAAELAQQLAKRGIAANCSDALEEACRVADIILTTTPSVEPIVQSDWIAPGTHITASGADAPGKCELDPALVQRAQLLVADKVDQCLDHGEFSNAALDKTRIIELGEVLAGSAGGRQNDEQVSIADMTGLASQDIAAATTVLKAAGVS